MHPPIFFTNCCIFGIGEGTGRAIAEAGGGVGMFAELFFVLVGSFGFCDGGFVGAELMVDYLPDHFVVLHDGKLVFWGGHGESCRMFDAVFGCFVRVVESFILMAVYFI